MAQIPVDIRDPPHTRLEGRSGHSNNIRGLPSECNQKRQAPEHDDSTRLYDFIKANLKLKLSCKDAELGIKCVEKILGSHYGYRVLTEEVDIRQYAVDKILGENAMVIATILCICKDFCNQEKQRKLLGLFTTTVENARLPVNTIPDEYVRGADSSYDKALPWLEYLTDLQEYDDHDIANEYACILASTGTGKTQLAVTARLKYTKAKTIYFNCMERNTRHSLVVHHVHGGKRLLLEASIFEENMRKSFWRSGDDDYKRSATYVKKWAESDNDDGSSVFIRILYTLLLRDDGFVPLDPVKLRDLKTQIKGKKFLFFLDEVPQKSSRSFHQVLLVRDTLRYLGIAPILMSTNTGAHDYVGQSSRETESSWCHSISILPECAMTGILGTKKYLVETERPIVLSKALSLINENKTVSLQHLVEGTRKHLQSSKQQAWKTNPCLQFVQLLCTNYKIEDKTFPLAQGVIGRHFGSIIQHKQLQENQIGVTYNGFESLRFMEDVSVATVSAKTEPLLYLSLVTWNEEMLLSCGKKSNDLFPLVDGVGRPMTVRAVFDNHKSQFRTSVNTGNPHATKLDGDLFETFVHAGFTLASMKTTKQVGKPYLCGMELKKFIPFVRQLLVSHKLDGLPKIPEIFNDIQGFDWPHVPALGGSNSGLPDVFGNEAKIGNLRRPPDIEMNDGYIIEMKPMFNQEQCNARCPQAESKKEKNISIEMKPMFNQEQCNARCPQAESKKEKNISIECKNLVGGVNATLLKCIFQRIPSGVKAAFIFVSKLQENIFAKTPRKTTIRHKTTGVIDSFHNHKDIKEHITIVRWELNKSPYFLKAKGEEIKAKKDTKLLVLIIETGFIDAGIWSRGLKRSRPFCTNLDPKRLKS